MSFPPVPENRRSRALARLSWLVLVIQASLVLPGCAGTQGAARAETSVIREDFDPQLLEDDDFLFQPSDVAVSDPGPSQREERSKPSLQVNRPPVKKEEEPEAPSSPQVIGPVYRIQVAAVKTREQAEQMRTNAVQWLGMPAYVKYIPPYYKVQVGDLSTKSEASRALKEVEGKGYSGCFVVYVRESRPPPAPSEGQGGIGESTDSEEGAARPEPPEEPTVETVPAQGYRVQIHSVADRDSSQLFFEAARRLLKREDVYLRFEPPFFRIRVGNCRTRDEAEDLVRFLDRAGYNAPFLVRTQILVPKEVQPGNE